MIYSDSHKVLVILGAGHDQLPMYEIARQRGLWIIGVDQDPQACAAGLADEFVQISIRDYEGLKEYFKDRKIQGIISPASDAAHETIYEISHEFDLPWKPSIKAVRGSCDKEYFLNQAALSGVKVPKHCANSHLKDMLDNVKALGLPVIVKPIDSSGSKGISFVKDLRELEKAFEYAYANSFNGKVIVEEYVQGTHFSAEVFRQKGETILFAISEKKLTGTDKFITLQHMIPAALDEALKKLVYNELTLLCQHFKIDDGPVNFDFIIQGNEIYHIEMGARLAGNGMPSLIKLCYEVDTYEMTLDLIMNNEREVYDSIIPPQSYSALKVITAERNGVFAEITGLDNLKCHPAFKEIKVFVKEDDKVSVFEQANNKLGYIMAAHTDINKVKELLAFADEKIKIKLK